MLGENKREIILGIDPGTTITGFGIVEAKHHRMALIDFGSIRPPAKRLKSQKYLIIYESILTLIDRYKVSCLAVETQYVGKNVQSGMTLGMARAAVMLAAALRKIDIFVYAPSQAKRAVVGKGNASKEQVRKMVRTLLSLNASPKEDAADALALAICHAHALSSGFHLKNLF